DLLAHLAVDLEVVLAAQPVVPDARRVRHGRVDALRLLRVVHVALPVLVSGCTAVMIFGGSEPTPSGRNTECDPPPASLWSTPRPRHDHLIANGAKRSCLGRRARARRQGGATRPAARRARSGGGPGTTCALP